MCPVKVFTRLCERKHWYKLLWVLMSKGTFSDVAAHFIYIHIFYCVQSSDSITNVDWMNSPDTIYWKILMSIWGMSGHAIKLLIFLEKKWLNYLLTVETLIRRRVWSGSPLFANYHDYNGLRIQRPNISRRLIFSGAIQQHTLRQWNRFMSALDTTTHSL